MFPALAPTALLIASEPTDDPAIGKRYAIAIERSVRRPFVGRLGEATIGGVVIQIRRAEPGQRYIIEVTSLRRNRFTGRMQAACRWHRPSDDADGACNVPPG